MIGDEKHTPPAASPESKEKKQVIAEWEVPIRGKLYHIEFEHGTTSGKRVLWVDGQASEQ